MTTKAGFARIHEAHEDEDNHEAREGREE